MLLIFEDVAWTVPEFDSSTASTLTGNQFPISNHSQKAAIPFI